jgi:hypothetical protein
VLLDEVKLMFEEGFCAGMSVMDLPVADVKHATSWSCTLGRRCFEFFRHKDAHRA